MTGKINSLSRGTGFFAWHPSARSGSATQTKFLRAKPCQECANFRVARAFQIFSVYFIRFACISIFQHVVQCKLLYLNIKIQSVIQAVPIFPQLGGIAFRQRLAFVLQCPFK